VTNSSLAINEGLEGEKGPLSCGARGRGVGVPGKGSKIYRRDSSRTRRTSPLGTSKETDVEALRKVEGKSYGGPLPKFLREKFGSGRAL